MSEEQKPTLSPEIETLMKDVRRFISDSKDDWEKRRELLDRINAVIPDGEMDMFVAAVREMARIGASYTDMIQTFNQLFTTQQGGGQFAEMFARGFANNPFLAGGMTGMAPNAFDMWRQMAEFMTAQARTFTPGNK
jgi:hypothetical protein